MNVVLALGWPENSTSKLLLIINATLPPQRNESHRKSKFQIEDPFETQVPKSYELFDQSVEYFTANYAGDDWFIDSFAPWLLLHKEENKGWKTFAQTMMSWLYIHMNGSRRRNTSIAHRMAVHLNTQQTIYGSTFYPTCATKMDILDAKDHWEKSDCPINWLPLQVSSRMSHAWVDTYSLFLNTFNVILGEFPNFLWAIGVGMNFELGGCGILEYGVEDWHWIQSVFFLEFQREFDQYGVTQTKSLERMRISFYKD